MNNADDADLDRRARTQRAKEAVLVNLARDPTLMAFDLDPEVGYADSNDRIDYQLRSNWEQTGTLTIQETQRVLLAAELGDPNLASQFAVNELIDFARRARSESPEVREESRRMLGQKQDAPAPIGDEPALLAARDELEQTTHELRRSHAHHHYEELPQPQPTASSEEDDKPTETEQRRDLEQRNRAMFSLPFQLAFFAALQQRGPSLVNTAVLFAAANEMTMWQRWNSFLPRMTPRNRPNPMALRRDSSEQFIAPTEPSPYNGGYHGRRPAPTVDMSDSD